MKIQQDKIKHFGVSALATLFVSAFLQMFFPTYVAVMTAAAFTFGLGMGKEYGDSVWDWFDLLADVIGILVGILVYWGFYKLVVLLLV